MFPYVYQIGLIASVKVVDNGGFVKMGELRHVVCFIEFARIDFINVVRLNLALLMPGSASFSQMVPPL